MKSINFNLGAKRHVENPNIMRNGIFLARCEVLAMQALLDASHPAHKALFDNDSYEFCIFAKFKSKDWNSGNDVDHTIGIRMRAIDFIGFGDEGFNPGAEIIQAEANNQYYSPMQTGRVFELGNEYESGKVYLMSKVVPDPVNNPVKECSNSTLGDLGIQKLISEMLELFPRTSEGFVMPMLGLYAIKLSAMHNRSYTVEAAADEIYALGLINEPDFSQDSLPSVQMSSEIWSATAPLCSNCYVSKFGLSPAASYWLLGENNNCFGVWGQIKEQTFLQLTSWRLKGYSFPITFPCSYTSHTPIFHLVRVNVPGQEATYLTEFPVVSHHNSNGEVSVVSWFGGELNLKYADFTPLNGRKVVYLLLLAEEDETDERAYRVMLKALSRAYQCGNRSFECLDWEKQQNIPYETLLAQAVERGYLKIEGLSMDFRTLMDSTLPWATRKPGVPLFGRVFQSGRIHLVVAARGVGKTEMLVLYSVMAVHAASFDKAFFENRFNRPIRVLYIQREMNLEADFEDRIKDAEKLLRRTAPGAMEATSSNGIDFYEPETSLVEADEQCKVLKKLAELDPEGASQWMLVIDSLKTEMPEVLNGGNIFREQVFPWLDFLRKKGIAISLLHHENQAGDISGPGSIQDLSDLVFHLVTTDKKLVNGEADVEIVQEKKRPLKGKQQATARWNWVTDERLGITGFLSEYLDDDAVGTMEAPEPAEQEPQAPDASMPTPPDDESQEKPDTLRLPEKLAELQAMPTDKMRVALFELWAKHGTQEDIAVALGCSKSSVAPLMRDCNVNKETYQEYLRTRNGYN